MARDPRNIIEGDYSRKIDSINITDIPNFTMEDFDPNDGKAVAKFIFRVERVCRTSYEYKAFIGFLRDYANMNECSFLKYASNRDYREIRIEIHHEPITLFDIVSTVFNKRLAKGESIHEDMVAKEVMYNHYKLHVGLIPLSETIHEMVHNQFLFIPTFAVFGHWDKFVDEYKDYIPIDTLSAIESIKERSANYDFKKETEILTPGFVHINVDDPDYNADTADLYKYMKNVLNDLQNKKPNY